MTAVMMRNMIKKETLIPMYYCMNLLLLCSCMLAKLLLLSLMQIEDPFRELSEYVLKEDKGKKSGKKRNISDYSSDEDVIDYRRKYSKKK